MTEAQEPKPKKTFFLKNLTWKQHIAAGWPLLLIIIGGAVGGALGAAAYFISGKIFNGTKSSGVKYTLATLIGITAVAGWIGIVTAIYLANPQLIDTESFNTSFKEQFMSSCTKGSDGNPDQLALCDCLADDVLANRTKKEILDMKATEKYLMETALPKCKPQG